MLRGAILVPGRTKVGIVTVDPPAPPPPAAGTVMGERLTSGNVFPGTTVPGFAVRLLPAPTCRPPDPVAELVVPGLVEEQEISIPMFSAASGCETLPIRHCWAAVEPLLRLNPLALALVA